MDGSFQPEVALFNIVVFIRTGSLRFPPGKAIVIKQRLVTLGEFIRMQFLMHRGRQTVRLVSLRDATKLPQRGPQAFAEAFKTFRNADAARLPVGIGKNEMVQQVIEWLAGNGYASSPICVKSDCASSPGRCT